MDNLGMTIYVLIWPIIVAAILFVLVRAFVREWRESKRTGEDMI